MACSKPIQIPIQIQLPLDRHLLTLADDLKPADIDLADAKKVCNKIFKTLQKNRRFKIDRAGIMGSVEKSTALACEFDLDCVIFINDITIEDFPKVFEFFDQTLELEESMSGIVFKVPKTKGAALQATVDGFEFDIVPAINYSQDPHTQRSRVLDQIRQLDHPSKDGYRYSSSLIQDQVDFIKKQSSFVHQLIRLAKYWNRTIFIEEYVSGRSTMIELIAVDAGIEEEKCNDKSLSRAFYRFLEKIQDLEKVKITFDTSVHALPDYISKQCPLVLDPSNPYNNFAYDLTRKRNEKIKNMFEHFAKVTILKLNNANYGFGLINLFAFQSSVLFPTPSGKGWHVGVDNGSGESKRFKVIERNASGNHDMVRFWKHFLSFNVKFLVKSESKTKEELQKDVQKAIDEMEGIERNWVTSKYSHNDFDVTFEIPSGNYLIRCSFDM